MKKESQEKPETQQESTSCATESTTSEAPIAELLAQIDHLQTQANEHKEKFLRTMADLDNFRKRAARDREELIKLATSNLIEDLLSILDNFKLGLDSAEQNEEIKKHVQGFHMIYDQLSQLLQAKGLQTLCPTDETFNPSEHECIAQQPSSEVPEDQIMQVVRVGYKLNNKLLRPASVIVSSGPQAQPATSDPEDQAQQ